MAALVIKKDGTKEPFDIEKLKESIGAAAHEAGLPADRASEVVSRISAVVFELVNHAEEVKTNDIREIIVKELSSGGLEPSIITAWEKYEKEKLAKNH